MKFLFVCTHQIQNLIPLFVELEKKKEIDFKVIYWDKMDNEHFDPFFNQKINFGIDTFKKYNYDYFFNNKKSTGEINTVSNKFFISLKLIKYLFNEKFDVVLVYGYYFPNFFALLIAKLLGKKTVIRTISYNLGKRSKIKKFLRVCYYKFFNIFVDEFWSIHNLNTDFFKNFGVKEEKIKNIPFNTINKQFLFNDDENFINLNKEFINKNVQICNKKIILFPGKFVRQKRPIFLIEAFLEAKVSNDWILVLVGGGGFFHKQVLEIINKEKRNKIYYLGFRSLKEMSMLYQLSEIVVLPSDYGETNGNALLEASQYNCSLIASDRVGSYPEILEDKAGLVFDASDKRDLTKKIELLTNDDDLRTQLKTNSLKFSKKIQPSYVADKIVEILKKNEL